MTLDITQITPKRNDEKDTAPPPVMVRLHNPNIGVQILVSEEKATRLLAEGTYREGGLPKRPSAKTPA
ncbi:hypothetical protein B7435_26855 [Mycolicibacterium peregrinum]|uniref:hypothetical protein n=1 Tax=Mycolicibacterium peregrinum TaxID=43304 RepID=UPI000B4ABA50|nr:hypothetical protein [Mycolicibacterium peregrinum]OWL97009.1 hypothetical protein B7435_26855 [Mycolicibacterium peregrinum]